MHKTKILFILFLFLFCIEMVLAETINFDASISKDLYDSEENVQIKIDITNNNSEKINVVLDIIFQPPENVEFFPPPISSELIINSGETYSNTFERYVKGGGDYNVIVKLTNGLSEEKQLKFKVLPSIPPADISLKICKDQSCTEKSKIFLKNNDIYINYDSGITNPSITTTLTYPDKSTQQITLPSSIKGEQIGTYELKVTTSKQGYKTIIQKTQFGVIEKQADIKTISASDLSEFVISGKARTKRNLFIGLIIGLVIIVLMIFIIFLKRKSSKVIEQS